VFLWTAIGVLTAGALAAVLWPLVRPRPAGADAADLDRAVYLAQLEEVERERRDGRIGAAEAEAARAEVARRLLASGRGSRPSGAEHPGRRRLAAALALVAVPAVALPLYLSLGNPLLPAQPLAARLEAPDAGNDIRTLVARAEEYLAENPNDGRGWDVLAPISFRLGRPADAASAWGQAIRLLGSTEPRETGLGEALIAANDGVVSAAARAAFERALAADASAVRPRYYLGLAREQEGDRAGAAETWRAMLAGAPADAPWRGFVETAIARVEGGPTPIPQPAAGAADAPGPSGAEVAAAAGMSEADRQAMIERMVSGLAGRLEAAPDDPEGWLRLIRAYAVLGRQDEAEGAVARALQGVASEEGRGRIRQLAADLGIAAQGTVR